MAPASRHSVPVDGRPPSRRLRAALTRGARSASARGNGTPAYLRSGFRHPWAILPAPIGSRKGAARNRHRSPPARDRCRSVRRAAESGTAQQRALPGGQRRQWRCRPPSPAGHASPLSRRCCSDGGSRQAARENASDTLQIIRRVRPGGWELLHNRLFFSCRCLGEPPPSLGLFRWCEDRGHRAPCDRPAPLPPVHIRSSSNFRSRSIYAAPSPAAGAAPSPLPPLGACSG